MWEEGVRDRTVTKTCIKLPIVTVSDISPDSSLHWIPCHSSLNGQIDMFMHNWGLYYDKENEGSVFFPLKVKGGWAGGWGGVRRSTVMGEKEEDELHIGGKKG